MIVSSHHIRVSLGWLTKVAETSRVCGTRGGECKCTQTSLERPRRGSGVIFKWTFKEEDGKMWTGFIRLRVGTMMSSDSLKCGHFLTDRGSDTFSKRTLLCSCSFVADAWETQQGAAICACHIYSHTTPVQRRVAVGIKMLSWPSLWKIRERRRSYKFPKLFDRHNRPISGDEGSK
jgi:hypothetical protein